MRTLAFFNNKGGVGKTTLVYHIAWMMAEIGLNVIVADLDPQSNVTAAFLTEERMDELWGDGGHPRTILGAVQPLVDRLGDLAEPYIEDVDGIGLIPGDLGLNAFEDRLGVAWPACLDDNKATSADAFRVITAFYRAMEHAAHKRKADLVLIDVGPNLGAINRAALVASDFVVVPLAADLFSLRGLRNLGPTLRDWREGWRKRRELGKVPDGLLMPKGTMEPIGYVILQHAVRQDRPVKAYQRWLTRIPNTYRTAVLGQPATTDPIEKDPNMLATIKHYRSLMPLAQNARKPVFALRPADGAIGSQAQAVGDAYADFERLVGTILAHSSTPP